MSKDPLVDTSRATIGRLAARSAVRWERMSGEHLRSVADWLGTPKTGAKAMRAARIADRLDALHRSLYLGDDAVALARTMTVAGLLTLARPLGCWTGANRYGLAAQVLGTRDQLLRRLQAEIDSAA